MESFETCPAWTLTGDWECGLIVGGLDGGFGPPNAYDGTNGLATRLNQNYNNTDGGWDISLASSPTFSLAGASEPTLIFRAWVDTEASYDGFNLRGSTDGVTYNLISTVTPAYSGSIGGQTAWYGRNSAQGWQEYRASLPSLAGQSTVGLRLSFRADTSATFPGVWVDNLRVVEANTVPLSITTATLADTGVGPYSGLVQRAGGSSSVVWSITAQTNGSWLAIAPSTGVLSGTPSASNIGPVSVTVRVTDATNAANFVERSYMFAVLAGPFVYSVPVTGLPTSFTPGWSVSLSAGNLYFTVTDSTSMTSAGTSTNRNGIGYVSTAGGAYTSVYTHNQTTVLADGGVAGANLDPQVVFHDGTALHAFNGILSLPRGVAGLYSVTGPTTSTALSLPSAPYGSGSKYGWSSNGSNFYLAQYSPTPYVILGANTAVSTPVAMTDVTTVTFVGPHGVAASATKLYVFDATTIRTYALDGAMSPSVPLVDTMTPVNVYTLASPCQTGSNRTATVLNSPMFPTKIYFTNWATSGTSSTAALNRICEATLDSGGLPTATTVVAGAATGLAAAGSADGPVASATFQNVTGMTFDNVNSRLYVLQKSNSVDATKVIRVVSLP